MVQKFYLKVLSNFKQNKAMTLIFPIQNKIKIRENRRNTFIFGQNDLKFFVHNLRTITQNKL